MSTRARIGRLNDDGTVTSIYTHSDGYPDHHAPILSEHYATTEDIDALLALGDLSALGETIGEDQGIGWFDARWNKFRVERDDPRRNWCLAYRRDRGESDVDAVTHPADEWPDYSQSFEYLFRDGHWLYREAATGERDWEPLPAKEAGDVPA